MPGLHPVKLSNASVKMRRDPVKLSHASVKLSRDPVEARRDPVKASHFWLCTVLECVVGCSFSQGAKAKGDGGLSPPNESAGLCASSCRKSYNSASDCLTNSGELCCDYGPACRPTPEGVARGDPRLRCPGGRGREWESARQFGLVSAWRRLAPLLLAS